MDFNNMIPDLHYYIHRKPTPNWEIEASVIPFIDVTYVVDGMAEYHIGDEIYHVKKGDLICIPRNTYRAATTSSENPVESYAANFFLWSQDGRELTLPLPVISHIGIVQKLIDRHRELSDTWVQKDFGHALKVRGIMCLILHQILCLLLDKSHLTYEDPRIKSSIHYINLHYSDPLCIDEMAQRFHLNPVYYGSLFRESMGMTFKQYVISVRLNYAENMLKSGEYSIGAVALQCGFSDIYYFSKLFKEKKGIPPSGLFPPERKRKRSKPTIGGLQE